ncbi:hypothetical protein C5167_005417 [Papaver somniferum]|uniref:Uncharacterized protein n=1 Tax=Papaver somniferum TaxID=3469 RepID=A0A4Y7JDN8_PAPSO|nr:hypothetical protein C5167_005417 [Papaver somniferum]
MAVTPSQTADNGCVATARWGWTVGGEVICRKLMVYELMVTAKMVLLRGYAGDSDYADGWRCKGGELDAVQWWYMMMVARSTATGTTAWVFFFACELNLVSKETLSAHMSTAHMSTAQGHVEQAPLLDNVVLMGRWLGLPARTGKIASCSCKCQLNFSGCLC